MATREFPAKFLTELVWDQDIVVSDKLVGHGRWSVEHECIFKHEGKFYQFEYSRPATECQENEMFYSDTVECIEVAPKEVLTTVYEPV